MLTDEDIIDDYLSYYYNLTGYEMDDSTLIYMYKIDNINHMYNNCLLIIW